MSKKSASFQSSNCLFAIPRRTSINPERYPHCIIYLVLYERLTDFYRGFGMLRPLNAPIKYATLFFRGIAPGEWYCLMRGNIDATLVLSPPF